MRDLVAALEYRLVFDLIGIDKKLATKQDR